MPGVTESLLINCIIQEFFASIPKFPCINNSDMI